MEVGQLMILLPLVHLPWDMMRQLGLLQLPDVQAISLKTDQQTLLRTEG